MQSISPAINPQAHRAAIDALEAQRSAYRRFAQQAQAQSGALVSGDMVSVSAFTDGADVEVGKLHEGARTTRALVDAASPGASEDRLRDLEHRMTDMMREARNAETAIQNLSTQLEAWRDAYGRQLAELGISAGGTTSGSETPTPEAIAATRRSGYGHSSTKESAAPRLLDRKG